MAKKPSLVGQTFGRLTVLEDAGRKIHRPGNTSALSKCLCACGAETTVANSHLRSGHTQSCGCFQRDQCSLPTGEANDNLALYRIKQGARARNLEWALSDDVVRALLAAPCHWCGDIRVNQLGKNYRLNGRHGYNGIDRLDSASGYVAGNVVACCGPCNLMKRTMSVKEFVERCRRIANRHVVT
jgi:hypothetical protein